MVNEILSRSMYQEWKLRLQGSDADRYENSTESREKFDVSKFTNIGKHDFESSFEAKWRERTLNLIRLQV